MVSLLVMMQMVLLVVMMHSVVVRSLVTKVLSVMDIVVIVEWLLMMVV